jgi:hypothetical protein
VLRPHLLFYWDAFLHLNSCRPAGFSLAPIPWTSVRDYARAHGIEDADELAELADLVTVLDRVFLEESRAKEEARQRPAGTGGRMRR